MKTTRRRFMSLLAGTAPVVVAAGALLGKRTLVPAYPDVTGSNLVTGYVGKGPIVYTFASPPEAAGKAFDEAFDKVYAEELWTGLRGVFK